MAKYSEKQEGSVEKYVMSES